MNGKQVPGGKSKFVCAFCYEVYKVRAVDFGQKAPKEVVKKPFEILKDKVIFWTKWFLHYSLNLLKVMVTFWGLRDSLKKWESTWKTTIIWEIICENISFSELSFILSLYIIWYTNIMLWVQLNCPKFCQSKDPILHILILQYSRVLKVI